MGFDPKVFKAYDIRGEYPGALNEELALAVGRAFSAFLGRPGKLVVARDMRLSSPSLAAAVIQGVCSMGADVVDVGMCSSDQFYFSVAHYGCDGGLIVTASHNPARYNGFKLVREQAIPISGDTGLVRIRELVETRGWGEPWAEPGRVTARDTTADFVDRVRSLCDMSAFAPLKVVMDASNGTAGLALTEIFRDSPLRITPLNFEPDGAFPNHEANPLIAENRAELERTVREQGADLGMAWDGDADRFFCVDEKGEFVPGDFMTALLADEVLMDRPPGAGVIYDLRASRAVRRAIEARGGVPIMSRVGHSFIKQRMRDEGAVFAGEVSGHYYFAEFFNVDTGMVPALYLLRRLTRTGRPLSEAVAGFRAGHHISGEINRLVEDPEAVMDRIEERFPDAAARYRMDGLTVEFDRWWFNLRASNTEPLIRLNLEADSPELMSERREMLLGLIGGEPA